MLVYGDPEFETTSTHFVQELSRDAAFPQTPDLDTVRALLIQAGQLEQALEDAWEARGRTAGSSLALARRLTDSAAATLFSEWIGRDSKGAWRRVRDCLNRFASLPVNTPIVVKIPEGFEFYALFPEAYAQSAKRWAESHSSIERKRVLVVGIRSIGTTLSAIVTVALRSAGWRAARVTVRPQGHPFERYARVPARFRVQPTCAVVVDEGPGLSGSSIAAVARALEGSGFTDITLMPGHAGEPGPAAAPTVRNLWDKLPKCVTRLEELRWKNKNLEEILAEAVPARHINPTSLAGLNGGHWRSEAFAEEDAWPVSGGPLERFKLLSKTKDYDAILWKFTGLGAKRGETADSVTRKPTPLVPPVLSRRFGFTATAWVYGKRLTPEDARSPDVLRALSDYLIWTSRGALSDEDHRRGIRRLEEMAWWNIKETLGERAAEKARSWSAEAMQTNPGRPYGDGRMAPHEWVRTAGGELVKTGSSGLANDHTLVGAQSFAWDLAGTMVEWRMDTPRQRWVYDSLRPAGLVISEGALRFYVLAYAAYRLGVLDLVKSHSPAEARRIQEMESHYQRVLKEL